jgi:AcrR family transcriptional regulator
MNARSEILGAGHEVLRRAGAQGLTLRAVAKQVGVTPMALYRHFADKDDLIDALMRDGLSAWEQRLRALPAGTPCVRIELAFDAFVDFALTEPERFEAAFMLAAPGARRYPEDFAADKSPVASLLLAEIRRAMRAKEIAGPSALEIALTLWALAQGLISLFRAGRFSEERVFRALYRRAMRRCLASFRKEQAK